MSNGHAHRALHGSAIRSRDRKGAVETTARRGGNSVCRGRAGRCHVGFRIARGLVVGAGNRSLTVAAPKRAPPTPHHALRESAIRSRDRKGAVETTARRGGDSVCRGRAGRCHVGFRIARGLVVGAGNRSLTVAAPKRAPPTPHHALRESAIRSRDRKGAVETTARRGGDSVCRGRAGRCHVGFRIARGLVVGAGNRSLTVAAPNEQGLRLRMRRATAPSRSRLRMGSGRRCASVPEGPEVA
jgi:hypothetical protein